MRTNPFKANLERLASKWPWWSSSSNTIFYRVWSALIYTIGAIFFFGNPNCKGWHVIVRTSLLCPTWTVLAPNDLEVQDQSTPNSIGFWRASRYTFGANMVNITWKRNDVSIYQGIIQVGPFYPQMTFKVKVNQHHISYSAGRPQYNLWCKFGDPSLKTWRVIDKPRNCYRTTDRQMDRVMTIPFWPKWLRDKNICI